jgi:transposase
MATPSFIRPLSPDQHLTLKAGLRSPDSFTLRRCQILTASAEGLRPSLIAARLGCASQTVRNAIRAFEAEGLACLRQKSNRPKSSRPELDDARCERLRALLHRSPRDFGKPTGLWTLALAAEVCHEQGLTAHRVSDETIRQALKRTGVGWKRAKTWITSPDPAYARKKGRATG